MSSGSFQRIASHASQSAITEDGLRCAPDKKDACADQDNSQVHSRQDRFFDQIGIAAKAFSRELDTKRLAETVADQAVQTLGCQQATVGLVIDEQMQFLSTRDWKQQTGAELSVEDEALLRSVVPAREARILDRSGMYHHAICAPVLNHQSHVIAVLGFFGCRRAGLFNQADLRAAECLANLASTAFDRSRIFDRMNEWTSSLETLLAFNAAVNQHLSPGELLQRLIQHAVQFLKSGGGMAGLAVTADADRIVMRSSDYFCDGRWEDRPRDWGPHQGTAGTVLESEFPAVINDYQESPLCDAELISRFGIHKALCVPIKNAAAKVLGFFEIHRKAGGDDFTWQDAAFLESLGNTAAVAIENAQLLHSLESHQRKIEALSAANVARLEQERSHISRELHDETGQMLIGMNLSLQVLARLIPDELEDAHGEITQLRANVRKSARQMRELSKRLRPPTLDELGFDNALQQLIADFESNGDTRIRVLAEDSIPKLPPNTATALYRIAQEALTNIFRHAYATDAWLKLTYDGVFLRFTIEDDGCGFDVNETQRGLGLLGMQERITMLGGRFRIRSSDRGTSIYVKVPIDG